MRFFAFLLMLVAAAGLPAQTFRPGDPVRDTNPSPMKLQCWDGAQFTACSFGGSGAASSQMQGTSANGAAPVGNPVTVAGSDGTTTRTMRTDAVGRQTLDPVNPGAVQGPAANGATAYGNPVLFGGSDGSLARTVRTDGNGALVFATAGTPGATPPAMGNLIMGTDGTVARTVRTNTAGGLVMEGNVGGTVAAGQADGGNPVKIGGVASASAPTAVTSGQRVNAWYTPNGSAASTLYAASGAVIGVNSPQDASGIPIGLDTRSWPMLYNGTTGDRARDVTSANGTTGVGVPASGVLCAYNATLPTYTTGQMGECQIDQKGNLGVFMKGSPSSGSDAVANSSFASTGVFTDATASGNLRLSAAAGMVFNGSTWDRARGDTTGSYVIGKGGLNINTNQVSVGTTATLIAAARTGRQKIGVTVTSAVQCAFGGSAVTLTTGWPLAAVAYAADNWDTAAALYAVCASTATVAYREQF